MFPEVRATSVAQPATRGWRARPVEPGYLEYDRLLECQHRIKNHLLLAAGMLELQARQCADEAARMVILSAHVRLQAVARLQSWTEGADDHAMVELEHYLGGYCYDLSEALGLSEPLRGGPRLKVKIASCQAAPDRAMTLALIIGELVTNAVKHAHAGVIAVDWRAERDGWRLVVADDGRGLPSEATVESGLGSRLLTRMAATLRGTWDIGTPGHHGAWIALRIAPDVLSQPRP